MKKDNNVILATQKEVDDFAKNHPSKMNDVIIVKNSDITNLDGLKHLEEVNSLSIFENPEIKDLKGLENLKKVNDRLLIYNNPRLDNIGALSNLESAKEVQIKGNADKKQNIESLPDLKKQFHLNQKPEKHEIDYLKKIAEKGSLPSSEFNDSINKKYNLDEPLKELDKFMEARFHASGGGEKNSLNKSIKELTDEVKTIAKKALGLTEEQEQKTEQVKKEPAKEKNQEKSEEVNQDLGKSPEEIHGIKLNKQQKSILENGESIYLRGMTLPSGEKTNGYVSLQDDPDQNENLKFIYGSDKIIIDSEIGKHKISDEERKDLERGRVVGPLDITDDFKGFLQVDRNINRVVVKTGEEIGIPNKIGGYELSSEDQNRLANNEEMLPRVYKGKYGYFMANVSMTPEGDGLIYKNVQGLTNKQAEEMMERVNGKQYSSANVSDIVDATIEASKNSNKEKNQEKIQNQEQTKEVRESLDPKFGKDYETLKEWMKDTSKLDKLDNLSPEFKKLYGIDKDIEALKDPKLESSKGHLIDNLKQTSEVIVDGSNAKFTSHNESFIKNTAGKEITKESFPEKIFNLKLSEDDKTVMAAGQKTMDRLFQDDQGFFKAKMSADKDGLKFHNVESLSTEQASKISKLNEATYDLADNLQQNKIKGQQM